MSISITPGKLGYEISRMLEEYALEAQEELDKAVRKAANETKKQIAATAPKRTGDYAKSWAVKTEHRGTKAVSATVYSKDRYQIAHLLEFGHANRGGGRTSARPHLKAAEEHGIEVLELELRRGLRNG